MCQLWQDGTILDIHKEMIHVTAAIISKAVLGSDIKSEQGDRTGQFAKTRKESIQYKI